MTTVIAISAPQYYVVSADSPTLITPTSWERRGQLCHTHRYSKPTRYIESLTIPSDAVISQRLPYKAGPLCSPLVSGRTRPRRYSNYNSIATAQTI